MNVPSNEPQTQKRRNTGLTLFDPRRAQPGYTLFTTLSGDGIVYLVDLNGTVVHQWNIPYSPYYAELLPNGNTLITEGLNGRLFEVTPQREVVWEYVNPYFSEFLFNNRDGSVPDELFRYYGGTMNSVFRSFRYSREQLPQLKN